MALTTIRFERLGFQPGDRLLDLGCGEGRHAISACLAQPVEAVGVDRRAQDLQTARARARQFAPKSDKVRQPLLALAEARGLPFADLSFDQVICSEVLEHIHDYGAVIQEIHRVLKPGGRAAVSVPRFFPEWVCWRLSSAYHQVEGGHVHIFRARRLRRALEASGLAFAGKHHAHALHVPYWWLKCLFWRDEGRPEAWPVAWYHRFLDWELLRAPQSARLLEALLNPLMGKSLVMYFVKAAGAGGAP